MMLRSVNEMIHYVIEAEDGEIGRCKDFLFDDFHWTIRYMVADTRTWLPGRKVLVSPIALGDPDWKRGCFPVRLSRQQIEESPLLDEDAPVSRQYETRWFDYFGWPYYWAGGGLWEADPYPAALYAKVRAELAEEEKKPEESHLRSVARCSFWARLHPWPSRHSRFFVEPPSEVLAFSAESFTDALFLCICLKREDEVSRIDRLPFHNDPITDIEILQLC
jgi:hypothetical protein